MDLAVGAKRVFVAMEHTTRDGRPRLVNECSLPVTALGVVQLIVTDLAVIEITSRGFLLREIAPGYEPTDVIALTEATLTVASDLKEIRI